MARLHPFTTFIKRTFLGKYLVAKPEDNSGIGMLMRFRDGLIETRLKDLAEGKKGRVDLLQTFLDARDEDGEKLKMDYIKAEILLVLLAGADTTGTAFQAMMFYIMSNKGVYEKMMEEIDEQTRNGNLTRDMPQCKFIFLCMCHEYQTNTLQMTKSSHTVPTT
jgi:cytochrome P450